VAVHDYVISNGTGAAVRSDLNGALAAIVSQNSSASEPSPTYAYMRWADTTAGVMKMRNGSNSAWISLYELDGTFLASDISLAAGSAAAPSLFFTGDTKTGLFSPGADTVALATAGSNRLHITSGGLVGIGTSAPASALDVSGGSIKLRNASSGTNFGYEVDVNHVTGVSQKMLTARYMIAGASGSLVDIAGINAEIENASFNLYGMSFRTGSSLTERVRIDNAGRVGIGTTSPAQKLEVVDGSISVGSSTNTSATNVLIAGYGYNLSGTRIGNTSIRSTYSSANNSASLEFYVDANGSSTTEKCRLDSSGRLLVGTSSDSGGALLQVNGDRIRIGTAKTPASATATGTTGEIAWDANYIYVCTATNTWKRTAIATW
jgi:hypothetical protein